MKKDNPVVVVITELLLKLISVSFLSPSQVIFLSIKDSVYV